MAAVGTVCPLAVSPRAYRVGRGLNARNPARERRTSSQTYQTRQLRCDHRQHRMVMCLQAPGVHCPMSTTTSHGILALLLHRGFKVVKRMTGKEIASAIADDAEKRIVSNSPDGGDGTVPCARPQSLWNLVLDLSRADDVTNDNGKELPAPFFKDMP